MVNGHHRRDHAQGRDGPGEGDPLREALGFPVPPALTASVERLRLAVDDWPSANALIIDHRSFPGAQVWVHQSNGELVNTNSGKCLDDTGFGGSGTQVQIWSCTGAANQSWTLP